MSVQDAREWKSNPREPDCWKKAPVIQESRISEANASPYLPAFCCVFLEHRILENRLHSTIASEIPFFGA